MTKDEVSLQLDLVNRRPIITSKETNASSNKMKEEAWAEIKNVYNSKNGQFPRLKDQLKAKWDSLKKAARKRYQQIRLNNLKTGGRKPDYIPHDDILDKVTGLLGSTCIGFEVAFGGDGVGTSEIVMIDGVSSPVQDIASDVLLEFTPEPEHFTLPICEAYNVDPTSQTSLKKLCLVRQCSGSQLMKIIARDTTIKLRDGENKAAMTITRAKSRKVDESIQPRRLYGMTNKSKELETSEGKKRKLNIGDGRRERNLAIAKYYEAKTIKLNLEIDILKEELSKKKMAKD